MIAKLTPGRKEDALAVCEAWRADRLGCLGFNFNEVLQLSTKLPKEPEWVFRKQRLSRSDLTLGEAVRPEWVFWSCDIPPGFLKNKTRVGVRILIFDVVSCELRSVRPTDMKQQPSRLRERGVLCEVLES